MRQKSRKCPKAQPGIDDATVNLANSRAILSHASSSLDLRTIGDALEDAGYHFLGVIRDNGEDPAEKAAIIEIRDLKIKLIVGVIISLVVHGLAMGHLFPFLRHFSASALTFVQLVLTTPVIFWVGDRFLIGTWKATRQKTSDMNTLVSLGALSAYLYSLAVTIFPGFFAQAGRPAYVYFDGASMIVTLILLGRFLEARAKGKTSAAIKKLVALKPSVARLVRGDEIVEIPIETSKSWGYFSGASWGKGPNRRGSFVRIIFYRRSNVDRRKYAGEQKPWGHGFRRYH